MTTLASSSNNPGAQRLPPAPLRRRAVMAAMSGGAAVAALAFAIHVWLETAAAPPILAGMVFVAAIAIMLINLRGHHPFARFGPANQVTMTRLVLVALVAGIIAEPPRSDIAWVVVIVTAVIAALDGVDGWLARRSGMSSAFGARFDMETDAFFMLVLCALVWRHHKAGPWVMAIGMMRYAFVAAGWMLPWLARPFQATRRGKTVAIWQLVALAFALVPQVPVTMSTLACGIALAALIWSFSVDITNLWRRRWG